MIKSLGIKWIIMGLLLLMFVPIVIFCAVQQTQYYTIMREDTSKYTEQFIQKIRYDIELSIGELDKMAVSLVYDEDIGDAVSGNLDDNILKAINEKLEESVILLEERNSINSNILLLSSDLKILTSTYDEWTGSYRILGPNWVNKIVQAKGEKVLISGYNVTKGMELDNIKVISIARSIRINNKHMGTLMIEVPIDYLTRICDGVDLGRNGFVALVDSDNYVIYNTNVHEIGNKFINIEYDENEPTYFIGELNNVKMFFVEARSQFSGIKVIGAIPQDEMENDINRLRKNLIIALSEMGVLLMIVAYISAYSLSKPIVEMKESMKQIEKGDFSVRVEQTCTNEIGSLQQGFNKMAEKVGVLIDREYTAVIREKEAQLGELMAIINPHFMYNTLEIISMTAYLNDDIKTVEMLGCLSDIFRFMTSSGSRFFSLQNEVICVKNYLSLINTRDDDIITVTWDLDENLYSYKTLKFILQPIVENSIIHGFNKHSQQKLIEIQIFQQSSNICISVYDNGCGMSDMRLEEVRKILASDNIDKTHPQMAIKNVHDRIRLAFGERYGVTIDSREGRGLIVKLLIPLME